MSKHKYKTNKTTICIKIPIETDEYLRKFILDNSRMRNKIRNDFVEEANKYKGDYNMYYDFDPSGFKTKYYHDVEIPEKRYDYYCIGLSEQVSTDFLKSKKMIITKNKKVLKGETSSKLGEFHFKRFDYNRYGFRVKLKPGMKTETPSSRLHILDNTVISFLIRANLHDEYNNRNREQLIITLKEPLFDDIISNGPNPKFIRYYESNGCVNGCTFDLLDVKDIGFKYECGKYYILLFIKVKYLINKDSLKYSNGRVAGIDTGIRHPITIYDDNGIHYYAMNDKTSRKIHYLERRINRLHKVYMYKYEYNQDHNFAVPSNNMIKIVKKIRRIYRKISNIKNNWSRNVAKLITTNYSMIVVDTFEQPDRSTKKDLPKRVINQINYANRFHSMYYTNEFIKCDCKKYGCTYKESPKRTTRTCSICNHINQPLKLTDKYLKCECCGNIIERDANAAKNCYDYAIEKSKVV